jgi:hypothetical protein
MNVTTLYDTAFWGGAYIDGVDDAEMIHTPLTSRVMFSGLYKFMGTGDRHLLRSRYQNEVYRL